MAFTSETTMRCRACRETRSRATDFPAGDAGVHDVADAAATVDVQVGAGAAAAVGVVVGAVVLPGIRVRNLAGSCPEAFSTLADDPAGA